MQIWMKQMNNFMHNYKRKEFERYYNDFDPFFYDPFDQLRRDNARMRREFRKFDSLFDSNRKDMKINFDKSNKISINKREDGKYIYFDLKFKNINKNDINIEVRDNVLTFSSLRGLSEIQLK